MTDLFTVAAEAVSALALMVLVNQQSKKAHRRPDPALCEHASKGDLVRVRELLATGVDPDSVDKDGVTALSAAAAAAEAKVLGALLEAGADPDEQDASGLTALMSAVIASGEMDLDGAQPVFLEVIELLLASGVDLDLEDEDGQTAMDYALSYDLDEVVTLLEDV
jgi:ankyrin repeat protein